jgi:hypothetical protein
VSESCRFGVAEAYVSCIPEKGEIDRRLLKGSTIDDDLISIHEEIVNRRQWRL